MSPTRILQRLHCLSAFYWYVCAWGAPSQKPTVCALCIAHMWLRVHERTYANARVRVSSACRLWSSSKERLDSLEGVGGAGVAELVPLTHRHGHCMHHFAQCAPHDRICTDGLMIGLANGEWMATTRKPISKLPNTTPNSLVSNLRAWMMWWCVDGFAPHAACCALVARHIDSTTSFPIITSPFVPGWPLPSNISNIFWLICPNG